MKKEEDDPDELLPEYDFSQMTGGVRGKYAAAYRQGTSLVRLDLGVSLSSEKGAGKGLEPLSPEASYIRRPAPKIKR